MIDRHYVNVNVAKWQYRHEEWARFVWTPFLQKIDPNFKYTDFDNFKNNLANALLEDWRYALAFFIDRTSYQSLKDIQTSKIASYLIEKIVKLNKEFSKEELQDLVSEIHQEKETGIVSYIRVPKDIERLRSVINYLISCSEINFTRIVQENNYSLNFLTRNFYQVGSKTANFYLKFLALLLQPKELLPIVIDTHVINSLKNYNLISNNNNGKEVERVIFSLSKEIDVSPIYLETALYEDSWRKLNKCR